jgi:hypothetical protein
MTVRSAECGVRSAELATPKPWRRRVRSAILLVAMLSAPVFAQQAQAPPPTEAQVRAAMAQGGVADAWPLIDRMPVELATVQLAVEVALAQKAPRVAAARLPLLADRAARLAIDSTDDAARVAACVVTTRLAGSVPCAEYLLAVTSGRQGTAIDRARAWVALRLLGANPAAVPSGWESEVRGASALELAAWAELPAASRVRLLEPLITSTDVGNQIAALATLQLVPGPEALALWRDLVAPGRLPPPPSYPGARTQLLVGLARHGDVESLKTLTPVEAQLSQSDRLVLAIGRAERGDAAGRAALITLVTSGNEVDAIRAAEALAIAGPEPRIESRVRSFLRDGGPPLRTRWLTVAARLKLGDTPEVVGHLDDASEEVRVAAALAVAVSIQK